MATQKKYFTNDGREILARCTVKEAKVSPRKMRLVVDLIRGKTVGQALEILRFTHRPSAVPYIERAVKSVMANASAGHPNPMELVIGEAIVEEGRVDKRRSYAPKGRPVPIRKRRSHLHLNLTEF